MTTKTPEQIARAVYGEGAHYLTTRRLMAAAIRADRAERAESLPEELDLMLSIWDSTDIADVPTFLDAWAERLSGVL